MTIGRLVVRRSWARVGASVVSVLGVVVLVGGCVWATAAEAPDEALFAMVGDTSGAGLRGRQAGGAGALTQVMELLDLGETLLLNLECVLQPDGAPAESCRQRPGNSTFRAPLGFADVLRPTGSTIATLANNHMLDCGGEGVLETVDALADRSIATVGAGASLDGACAPLELSIGGLDVGVVAYLVMGPNPYTAGRDTPGVASWEKCSPVETLGRLAERNDLVIASLHFHLRRGWTREAPEDNRRIVEEALNSGADVVVGHGPHVAHGVLTCNGGIGMLSLGNFILGTGYNMPPEAQESLLAKLRVRDSSLELELVPLVLDDDGWPHAASSEEAGEILRHVERTSLEMGTRLEVTNGRASLRVDRVGRVTPSSGP